MSTHPRLLLIEDDPTQVALVRHWLNDRYQVHSCADGEEGLALTRRETFDLLLCDVRLPGLSGLQIAERLASQPDAPPVLLMTGDADVELAIRAIEHGVVGYLLKPLDRRTLDGRLQEALRARRRSKAAMEAFRQDKVATLAHDLRNPLTALMMLLDAIDADQPSDIDELVALGRVSAKALLELLDQALTGPEEHAHVRLDELLRDSVQSFQAGAWAKDLVVTLGPFEPTWVHDPEGRLRSVVDNLLSNAMKFTPRGGRVRVCMQVHDTYAEVMVIDDGPGIPPGELHRLFERGVTGSARPTAGEPSNGLGLHLVRRTVEALGGQVWVTSPGPGQGSTFAFRVPSGRCSCAPGELRCAS